MTGLDTASVTEQVSGDKGVSLYISIKQIPKDLFNSATQRNVRGVDVPVRKMEQCGPLIQLPSHPVQLNTLLKNCVPRPPTSHQVLLKWCSSSGLKETLVHISVAEIPVCGAGGWARGC